MWLVGHARDHSPFVEDGKDDVEALQAVLEVQRPIDRVEGDQVWPARGDVGGDVVFLALFHKEASIFEESCDRRCEEGLDGEVGIGERVLKRIADVFLDDTRFTFFRLSLNKLGQVGGLDQVGEKQLDGLLETEFADGSHVEIPPAAM